MSFVFGSIVAFLAMNSGDFMLGLLFLTTLNMTVMPAVLFLLEKIYELMEARL